MQCEHSAVCPLHTSAPVRTTFRAVANSHALCLPSHLHDPTLPAVTFKHPHRCACTPVPQLWTTLFPLTF